MIFKHFKVLSALTIVLLAEGKHQEHLRSPGGKDEDRDLVMLGNPICKGVSLPIGYSSFGIDENTLYWGEFLCAGEYRFGMDDQSGRLQLQKLSPNNDNEWHVKWQANNIDGDSVRLQEDGNLVVYDEYDNPVWASNTDGNPDSKLTLYNGGGVHLTSSDGILLWSPDGYDIDWICVGDYLEAGEELHNGEYICSEDTIIGFEEGTLLWEEFGLRAKTWTRRFEANLWTGGVGDKVVMQHDGNLVIYTSDGEALWSSRTNGNPGTILNTYGLNIDGMFFMVLPGSNPWTRLSNVHSKCIGEELLPDRRMSPGEFLCNDADRYRFGLDTIGDLSFFDKEDRFEKMWSAGTAGRYSNYLKMQADGNLVVYTYDNRPLWASNTSGNRGAKLRVNSDGSVTLRLADNELSVLDDVNIPPDPRTCLGEVSAGQVLQRNEMVGSCEFGLDGDGRVVHTGRGYWSPLDYMGDYYDTDGRFGDYAVFQKDGNFVVYTSDGEALWSTRTNEGYPKENLSTNCRPRDVVCPITFSSNTEQRDWFPKEYYCRGSRLHAGERLDPKEYICSHGHRFGLDKAGRLSLWLRGKKMFSFGNAKGYGNHVRMQDDGNLVVYNFEKNPLWSSKTQNHPGSYASINDDGDIAVFGTNGHPFWVFSLARTHGCI